MLIRNAFLLALCAPADTDTPAPAIAGGGDAAAAVAAVETPPAVVAPKAGLIDQALAAFQGKGVLLAENTTLKGTNATQTARIAALEGQVAALTTERDGLRAEFGRLEAALATANAEKVTVQAEVTHQLASIGVPESGLPKGGPEKGVEETVEELRKQLDAPSLSAGERGDLVTRIRKLSKSN